MYPGYNVGVSNYEVQARWLTRAFLFVSALEYTNEYGENAGQANGKVDAMQQFMLFTGTGDGPFETCGYIQGGEYTTSWYYVSTMRSFMGDMQYEKTIHEGKITDALKQNDDNTIFVQQYGYNALDVSNANKAFALWLGTSKGNDESNTRDYTLALPAGTTKAYLAELVDGSITGKRTEIAIPASGEITVKLSEKPVFVLTESSLNESISRADFVAQLVNALDLELPAGAQAAPFADIQNHAAKESIDVAYALGIAYGVNDTSFAPASVITREQAASMIIRACNALNLNTAGAAVYNFADGSRIANWARANAQMATVSGIMATKAGNRFDPKGIVTRAEAEYIIAQILGL